MVGFDEHRSFRLVTPTAIIGGEAGLGFTSSSHCKKKSEDQRSPIHDALLQNELNNKAISSGLR